MKAVARDQCVGRLGRLWAWIKAFAPSLALALGTTVLVWLAFPPVDFGAVMWVAFVPWLVLVAVAPPKRAALASLAGGWAAFLLLVHWIRYVTWAGWFGLAFYCALYWVAAALLIGWMRRRRMPFILSMPLVCTVLEFIRANLFTGFPFFFLAHSQHNYLPIIQIADITGTYGITFLLGLVNGGIADVLLSRPTRWGTSPQPRPLGCREDSGDGTTPDSHKPGRLRRACLIRLGVIALVTLGVLGYGIARLRTLDPQPGPVVALIQGNVPQDLKHSPSLDDALGVLDRHVQLTMKTLPEQPDLIIWPETMFPAPMNEAQNAKLIEWLLTHQKKEYQDYGRFLSRCREALQTVSEAAGCPLLIGAETSGGKYEGRANSLYLIGPGARILGRYDKIHLVIFGEYVPLANILPFLKLLRPEVMGPDLTPGVTRTLFDLPLRHRDAPARHGGTTRFGASICYEDAEAELFRLFVRDGADFMVNSTNDGWFRASTELDEHLAVCAFRAVETRAPIARCANTGISALIAPDGRITHSIMRADGARREVEGTLVAPLTLTPLRSFYAAHGNLFAWACVLLLVTLAIVCGVRRS